MAGFLSSLMSGGLQGILGGAKEIIDVLHTSDEEKGELHLKLESLITARMLALEESLRARFTMVQEIIASEMKSGNSYTKNARPTIVYTGLIIHVVNAFGPMFALERVEIDPNFTYVWGGVCGVWIVGRSAERIGAGGKTTQRITGNPNLEI